MTSKKRRGKKVSPFGRGVKRSAEKLRKKGGKGEPKRFIRKEKKSLFTRRGGFLNFIIRGGKKKKKIIQEEKGEEASRYWKSSRGKRGDLF